MADLTIREILDERKKRYNTVEEIWQWFKKGQTRRISGGEFLEFWYVLTEEEIEMLHKMPLR